ncbi:MAG: hypothetical protein SWJ54_15825 [Cyanobacteriota bacterium]|nr:hypothetical protein [Cyanobacteriota bacterium]
MTFDELIVEDNPVGENTVIRRQDTEVILAVLPGVEAADLTRENFFPVTPEADVETDDTTDEAITESDPNPVNPNPTQPLNPVDPIDPIEPDPTNPVDPVDPIDPTEPDPTNPVDPVDPTEPEPINTSDTLHLLFNFRFRTILEWITLTW